MNLGFVSQYSQMCNGPSSEGSDAMKFFDFYKKLKRFRLFEPSVGIMGLTVCVIFCFFLLDYRSATKGVRFPSQNARFLWLKIDGDGDGGRKKIEFLSGEDGGCDVFDGDWVWDESYPLYDSKDCRFLDDGFRCSENGRPDLFYTKWRWQPRNCNLPRAPFLVLQSRPPPKSPTKIKTTLKLGEMDWMSSRWKDADLLVLNTGHWWNFEKTMRGGCYFQEGFDVKMDMEVDNAYQKALQTVTEWIHSEVNATKTQVFFRTYAPVHFRGGDWRSGGNCHLETLPELGSSLVPSQTWTKYTIFSEILASYVNSSNFRALDVLNITHMTSRRKDGHSSLYYLGSNVGPAPIHRQDCSHWCLPGVPDAWNELLYAIFLKREMSKASNSSSVSAQVS